MQGQADECTLKNFWLRRVEAPLGLAIGVSILGPRNSEFMPFPYCGSTESNMILV